MKERSGIKTIEQLISLQEKYKTDQAIASTFGISRQAIHQMRKKFSLQSVRNKNAERNEKIIKAYKQGISGPTIAHVQGISVSQTYRIINRLK